MESLKSAQIIQLRWSALSHPPPGPMPSWTDFCTELNWLEEKQGTV